MGWWAGGTLCTPASLAGCVRLATALCGLPFPVWLAGRVILCVGILHPCQGPALPSNQAIEQQATLQLAAWRWPSPPPAIRHS